MAITRKMAAAASVIAGVLLLALAWIYLGGGKGVQRVAVVLGALLLVMLAVSALAGWLAPRLGQWWHRRQNRVAMNRLDWKVIEGGGGRKRDCEKQHSMGVCSGLDCYFYQSCTLNIKKPLAK